MLDYNMIKLFCKGFLQWEGGWRRGVLLRWMMRQGWR